MSKRYGQGNRSGTGTSGTVKGKEKDEGYNKEKKSYISLPGLLFLSHTASKFFITHIRVQVDLEFKLFCFYF